MADRWSLQIRLTRADVGPPASPDLAAISAWRQVSEALPEAATVTAHDEAEGYTLDLAAPSAPQVERREVEAYCIDYEGDVADGVALSGRVLLADPEDPRMADLVAAPSALPLVSWIIHRLGDYADAGYGRDAIQAAIWALTDDVLTFDADAQAIVADAQANGGGFIPGPGDVVALVIAPDQDVDPETGEPTTNRQTMICGVRYDLLLSEGQPVGAQPVYAGAAYSDWSTMRLVIDFAHLHACGVRPGDTVWDMTGRHRFTLPPGSSLTSDGWSADASQGLYLPASDDWDLVPGTVLDAVHNPEGWTDPDFRLLAGCWPDGGPYEWGFRQGAPGQYLYLSNTVASGPALSRTLGADAWYWYRIANTDKQRVYLNGVDYEIAKNTAANSATASPFHIGGQGRWRLLTIGDKVHAFGVNVFPDATPPLDAPQVGPAPSTGGTFNPFTGLWT